MTKCKFGLTNNQLKLIAMFSMLADHMGKELFPDIVFLQYIGRLALPVFAYMIAEGCIFTRNKKTHLLRIGLLAFGCQSVYFVFEHSLYQNILVTFLLSVMTIYSIENFIKRKSLSAGILMSVEVLAVITLTMLPYIVETDFRIDYGLFGVLLPVFVYFAKSKAQKLILAAGCLILISLNLGGFQWLSLFSLLLLYFYNGKRGKLNMKYVFYVFYPAHLAAIYLVKMLIGGLN